MTLDNELSEQFLEWVRGRYFGKHRGILTDNADPTNRGRLKVRVPAVLDDLEVWAMPCAPCAGAGMGFYALPEQGTGVWVEFEAGDPSYPIWTGFFWADDELPENEAGKQASAPLKIWRSAQGLLLVLDDDGQTISLSDQNGNNLLRIEPQPGQITMQAVTKVVVEAPQIELVQNAPHPLVFGDDLLQYLNQLVSMFNSHLHPGELAAGVPVTPAPPVPPFPPATPALLSIKVKTG
jgi:Type VI secretion system/phage-baseplate injector OB domain